jgi:hypothetical protein
MRCQRTQLRRTQHRSQALAYLLDDTGPIVKSNRGRIGYAQQREEHRGCDKRNGVCRDRNRRRKPLDREASCARTGNLSCGAADLEPGIALNELLTRDDVGEERLVRHVEHRRECANAHTDCIELLDAQRAEQCCDRHRAQEECSPSIGRNQQWPSVEPVNPRAGRQAQLKGKG